MAQATLDARLRLDSKEFTSGMQRALASAKTIGAQISRAFTSFPGLIGGGAVGGFLVSALGTAAEREQMVFSLASVTGGMEAANAQFERLKEIALQPGLDLPTAVKGAARLQAVGMTAEEAERALRELGNAVAMVGGGAPQLESAVMAISQMFDKNEAGGRDFLKLAREVPILRSALESLGTTDALEMLSSGRDLSATIIDKLSEAPRVMENIRNEIDKTRQRIDDAKEKIGKAIAPAAIGGMKALAESLKGWGMIADFLGAGPADELMKREKAGMANKQKWNRDAQITAERTADEVHAAAQDMMAIKSSVDAFYRQPAGDVPFSEMLEDARKNAQGMRDAMLEAVFGPSEFEKALKQANSEADKLAKDLNDAWMDWEAMGPPRELFDAQNLKDAKDFMDAFNEAVDKELMGPRERRAEREEARERRRAERRVINQEAREATRDAERKFNADRNRPLGFFDREKTFRDFKNRFKDAAAAGANAEIKNILSTSRDHLKDIKTTLQGLDTI